MGSETPAPPGARRRRRPGRRRDPGRRAAARPREHAPPGTRGGAARGRRLRDDDPELLLEPDLALRPDPRARQGRTTIDAYQQNTGDKVFYRGHYYSARAPGPGALLAALLRGAQPASAPTRVARESQAQRGDDEMIYFVGLWGNVLPGLAAGAARVARGRALRARLRRRRRGDRSGSARWCCRSRRCCSRTSSARSSASPPSR